MEVQDEREVPISAIDLYQNFLTKTIKVNPENDIDEALSIFAKKINRKASNDNLRHSKLLLKK